MEPISPAERASMMRAHMGVVTAVMADNQSLIEQQLTATFSDLVRNSGGDQRELLGRIGKQFEADARVTTLIINAFAQTANLNRDQVNEVVALAVAGLEDGDFKGFQP